MQVILISNNQKMEIEYQNLELMLYHDELDNIQEVLIEVSPNSFRKISAQNLKLLLNIKRIQFNISIMKLEGNDTIPVLVDDIDIHKDNLIPELFNTIMRIQLLSSTTPYLKTNTICEIGTMFIDCIDGTRKKTEYRDFYSNILNKSLE